jgi:hypothetical protein
MPACLYTLFSQWQCRGDRGYTIVKYQTLRPARASDGGDGRDRHRPCVCRRAAGCYITGSAHGHRRKVITMHTRHSTRGNRQKWVVMLVLLAVWLVASPVPGHAWRGGRVFISPSIVVPFGPFWRPYWGPSPYAYPYASPYAYPPIVVQPSPQVSVQPPPPNYWYYCDNPKGYYPYVQQCPGGWRPVNPTPR